MRNISVATNERTMILALAPCAALGHSASVVKMLGSYRYD